MPNRRPLVLLPVTLAILGFGCTKTVVISPEPPTTAVVAPDPSTVSLSPDNSGVVVPDVTGMDLQTAQDTLQAAGFYNLGSHDVTGETSFQILDRNWLVVDQTPGSGATASISERIELGVTRR
jgi:beta-lactam-binding protein with PASTA domain